MSIISASGIGNQSARAEISAGRAIAKLATVGTPDPTAARRNDVGVMNK